MLRRGPSSKSDAPASVGRRVVYAVGDIHGRFDLLSQMLRTIHADLATAVRRLRSKVVFLGDYIDRGPKSRDVIQALIGASRLREVDVLCLRGNHEAAFLDFIDSPETGSAWLDWGGLETLKSYGLDPSLGGTDEPKELAALHARMLDRIPAEHIAFLRTLPLSAEVSDYMFVHAGVRPKRALSEQRESDLLWIREPFLRHRTPLEKLIVHGHTPQAEPFRSAFRIGVDTGAYKSGILTAVRLEEADVRFIQVSAAGRRRSRALPLADASASPLRRP